jgi:hypothetical protein
LDSKLFFASAVPASLARGGFNSPMRLAFLLRVPPDRAGNFSFTDAGIFGSYKPLFEYEKRLGKRDFGKRLAAGIFLGAAGGRQRKGEG